MSLDEDKVVVILYLTQKTFRRHINARISPKPDDTSFVNYDNGNALGAAALDDYDLCTNEDIFIGKLTQEQTDIIRELDENDMRLIIYPDGSVKLEKYE